MSVNSSIGNLGMCLHRMSRGAAFRKALVMNSSPEPVPYLQPLLDAVDLFEALNLGYALIGGVASMYYGRARFTEDLDFVAVSGHMDVLVKHPETMKQFHFDPRSTWKLYHESGVEADVWKDEHSDAIIARSREVEVAGRRIRIADPHDLIAMKLRAGRLQDDYDISEIVRHQSIEDGRIESEVTEEQFRHFLEVKRRI